MENMQSNPSRFDLPSTFSADDVRSEIETKSEGCSEEIDPLFLPPTESYGSPNKENSDGSGSPENVCRSSSLTSATETNVALLSPSSNTHGSCLQSGSLPDYFHSDYNTPLALQRATPLSTLEDRSFDFVPAALKLLNTPSSSDNLPFDVNGGISSVAKNNGDEFLLAATEKISCIDDITARTRIGIETSVDQRTVDVCPAYDQIKMVHSKLEVRSKRLLSTDVPYTTVGCKCKTSHCLKLYCHCFQSGTLCDKLLCKCSHCSNTMDDSSPSGARTNAIYEILQRRVDAFEPFVKKKNTSINKECCSCKTNR